jgi:hypothetical protein
MPRYLATVVIEEESSHGGSVELTVGVVGGSRRGSSCPIWAARCRIGGVEFVTALAAKGSPPPIAMIESSPT